MNGIRKIFVLIVVGFATQLAGSGPGMADELKFLNIESATVKYKHTGSTSGWSELCISDFGNLMVDRRELTTSMLGFSTKESKKVITRGAEITTVDLEKMSASVTRNPLYDSMARQVEQKGGVRTGQEMMEIMGGKKTDRTGNYANHDCVFWTLMGGNSCVTPEGISVFLKVDMMGISSMTQEAIEVHEGEPCSQEDISIPDGIKVKKVDMDQIMNGRQSLESVPSSDASEVDSSNNGESPMGFDLNKLKEMFSQ
ncbi:MAG: hypothetical protein GXP10_06335 [Gammaproteobacteria bacterium]|nr:hypothetical protein [Gammaproteobacteria bacterium]